jgi:pimeloyl-ACP methyl ester carboxylesterase
VVGSEGIIELMIPDAANQKLVLGNPSKTSKIESILWSFWPPSRRQVGTDNDSQQFTNLNLPLADIRVPTLIVHGTADINVPFSHAELLAEKIPHAVLHAIPEADHMMPFSHEEEVQAVLGEFLKELDD